MPEKQSHMKFTEEWVMYMEKHVLVKKMFTNELNMGLPLWTWVKKTVHAVETHCLSGKEGDADSLLGHEKPMIIDFME